MNDNIIQISFPQASYADKINGQHNVIDSLDVAIEAMEARAMALRSEAIFLCEDIKRARKQREEEIERLDRIVNG